MKKLYVAAAVVALLAVSAVIYQQNSGDQNRIGTVDVNNSSQRLADLERDSHVVTIEDSSFDPARLTIDSSGTDTVSSVTWVNEDGTTHYITVARGESIIFSRTIPAGGNFSWSFYEKGEYRFTSGEIEESGKIIVK